MGTVRQKPPPEYELTNKRSCARAGSIHSPAFVPVRMVTTRSSLSRCYERKIRSENDALNRSYLVVEPKMGRKREDAPFGDLWITMPRKQAQHFPKETSLRTSFVMCSIYYHCSIAYHCALSARVDISFSLHALGSTRKLDRQNVRKKQSTAQQT
jgi:hypothetical protein